MRRFNTLLGRPLPTSIVDIVLGAAGHPIDFTTDKTLDQSRQVFVEPFLDHRPHDLLHEVFDGARTHTHGLAHTFAGDGRRVPEELADEMEDLQRR